MEKCIEHKAWASVCRAIRASLSLPSVSSFSLTPFFVSPFFPCRKDPRALLSFGDDLANEGPEFKTKKTSASRRAAKVTEREQHKEKKGKKKKEKVLSR